MRGPRVRAVLRFIGGTHLKGAEAGHLLIVSPIDTINAPSMPTKRWRPRRRTECGTTV
jgi:hypothetical protein